MTPIELIKSIRESFDGAEHVYTNGSCYKFHLILKTAFPQAEPYLMVDHIITKIDNVFYDITGVVIVPYEEGSMDDCKFKMDLSGAKWDKKPFAPIRTIRVEEGAVMIEENKDCKTTMARVWRTKSSHNQEIVPVPRVKITQGKNTVVLDQRHFEVALQRWFADEEG